MEIAKLVLEYVQVLAWPAVCLISLLVLRRPIVSILDRLRRAELPGGVALDIAEKIAIAQSLAVEVQASSDHKHPAPTLPLTEANTRMVSLGLQPTLSGLDLSYYHKLATVNPNLALAGLRMEIETIIRNLLKGFQLDGDRKEPSRRSLERLLVAGAITAEQNRFLNEILSICNDAIHLQSVSQDRAVSVIDLAGTLIDDYLSWLQWGFPDK